MTKPNIQIAPLKFNGYDFATYALEIKMTINCNAACDVYLMYATEVTKLRNGQQFDFIRSLKGTLTATFTETNTFVISKTIVAVVVNPSNANYIMANYYLQQLLPDNNVAAIIIVPILIFMCCCCVWSCFGGVFGVYRRKPQWFGYYPLYYQQPQPVYYTGGGSQYYGSVGNNTGGGFSSGGSGGGNQYSGSVTGNTGGSSGGGNQYSN